MSRFGAKFGIVCAALACLGWSEPARAETIIVKKTTYFSIGGRTASDLDREMMLRGPLSKTTGRRHPGVTQIRFAGAATYVSKNGRCRVGDAKVRLSTKIMLPRWTNRRKASAQLGLIWDTLSSDIKRHEERHAEIARTHARDFERRILALPPARNCQILQAKVNVLSEQAMIDHDKDQRRFDRIEAVNFENRIMRLLKHRMDAKKSQ